MTTSKLPARPSLESLRKQAKKLARDIAAGRCRRHRPGACSAAESRAAVVTA